MKEPPSLLSLFTPFQSDRPTRGPRKDIDTKKVPRIRSMEDTHMWNSVPQNTRDLPSYSRFKREIRRHLFMMDA